MRVTLKLEFCGIKMFEQKWSQCIINCLKHLNETTSNDLITNKRKITINAVKVEKGS